MKAEYSELHFAEEVDYCSSHLLVVAAPRF